jgi:DNA-directed RNA polymerase, mitochondrial
LITDQTHENAEAPLPPELSNAIAKLKKQDARVERNFGYGDTVGGLGVVRKFHPEITQAVLSKLELTKSTKLSPLDRKLMAELRKLKPEVIALAILQTALHVVVSQWQWTQGCQNVGLALAGECWNAGVTHDNPRLAAKAAKAARAKNSSLTHRRQAMRSAWKRGRDEDSDTFKTKKWSSRLCAHAGNWGLDVLVEAIPDVFTRAHNEHSGQLMLTITEGGQALADDAVAEAVLSHPVWLPTEAPPRPWTGMHTGGTWDKRLQPSLSLVRTRHKDAEAACRQAINDGTMRPCVDAVNVLQAVPWRINTRVLGVIEACYELGIKVPGLPTTDDLPVPERPTGWTELADGERRYHRYRVAQVMQANRGFVSDRCLYQEDMTTAKMLAEYKQFHTAMNMDWRGRVYGVPSFNFQREDRVRSLFLFADGEPIGEAGLYWLKVHVANCGDYNKISKRPFDERVQWTNNNLDLITDVARAPIQSAARWLTADKPFMFLAACGELTAALATGSQFITRLPVSFDGSCSGLQHLCAMTRAQEGSLVNLTPSELPQDVYQTVATRAATRIADEAAGTDATSAARSLAEMCLSYGVTRKVVKRNVMTYSYSSKKYGMAEQQREDLMRPLAFDVLSKKLEEHPFGEDNGFAASKYLAEHVYSAIEEAVHLPAQAMTFLQKLAKALAHEGKPLRWTTPCGLPWINRYHKADCERVTLWMHDRGVRSPYTVKIATGHQNEIDKDKSAAAVAPNFVHACDAAHLLRVALGANRAGVSGLATVHDSFGCLASQAGKFRRIILEEFVALYQTHDPLSEVFASARRDLTHPDCDRMPTVPEKGPLNIEEVLNAQFAFA